MEKESSTVLANISPIGTEVGFFFFFFFVMLVAGGDSVDDRDVDSGRLAHRFPNLLDVDIVQACIVSPLIRILAQGCPNLRRLVLLGATNDGLVSIANECLAL
ncbi:hypothetical protein L2E82_51373 [Cichorium intybus]|nr:hypothetical protein L2E82_51373 [Cichorium intybus]